jgi:hypothetical protein
MSSLRTLEVHPVALAVVATALHDGTNSMGYPPQLEGFVIQANGGAVHLGGPGVTGEANGFTVREGETINILGFLSRGSPFAYDLTKLYYIGGPWKLVLERQI